MSFGWEKGYSFVWRHGPIEVSTYYQEQYIKHLGTGLKYEITIWGKGEPIFRTIEALMKYFGGYYTYGMDKTTLPYLRGKYYEIYKPGKDGNPEYVFHLVDWEFIAAYFNGTDDEKVKDIYNLSRFVKEKNTCLRTIKLISIKGISVKKYLTYINIYHKFDILLYV